MSFNQELLYSKDFMGRALEPRYRVSDDKEHTESAYDDFLSSVDPDLFILPGSNNQDMAELRARGLASNIHYFSETKDLDADILTPRQEYDWEIEIIDDLCRDYDLGLKLSEEELGHGLVTSIDDVIAADQASEAGDTLVYNTSQAHSQALDAAADVVHNDKEYHVFGFGNDSLFENFKQWVNAKRQRHYFSRERTF